MTHGTERLARISADTCLSISEAEESLNNGMIGYDHTTNRYFVDIPQLRRQRRSEQYRKEVMRLRRQWLGRTNNSWLTK